MINEASYCGQVFLEWDYVGISNIGPPFLFPAGFESSTLWRKLRTYRFRQTNCYECKYSRFMEVFYSPIVMVVVVSLII